MENENPKPPKAMEDSVMRALVDEAMANADEYKELPLPFDIMGMGLRDLQHLRQEHEERTIRFGYTLEEIKSMVEMIMRASAEERRTWSLTLPSELIKVYMDTLIAGVLMGSRPKTIIFCREDDMIVYCTVDNEVAQDAQKTA